VTVLAGPFPSDADSPGRRLPGHSHRTILIGKPGLSDSGRQPVSLAQPVRIIKTALEVNSGVVCSLPVHDPDATGRGIHARECLGIEEKTRKTKIQNTPVPPYVYDNTVIEIARRTKPSTARTGNNGRQQGISAKSP